MIAERKNCVFSRPEARRSIALGAVAAVLILGCTASAADDDAPKVSAEVAASANFGLEPVAWWEPPKIESSGGVLRATLEVDYANHTVRDHTGASKRLRLRSYNGRLVGPTLVFRAGDTLHVKLDNRLPRNSGTPDDAEAAVAHHQAAMMECPNRPHDFNTTNLHTHGLHISPKSPADDVLRRVDPKTHYDYVFPILPAGNPSGQPRGVHYPGTFWYHAHHHGSTAMQLASGMAGALLLRGDLDEEPEIKTANERLFILQQIAYGEDGTIEDFGELRDNWEKVVQERTRINGRLYPKIELRPDQIERWRLIDSGVFADLPLEIVPKDLQSPSFRVYQIAADGITFAAPQQVTGPVELAPGNRVDLLVWAPAQPGTYYLRKARSNFDLTALGMGEATPAGPELLAEIEVVNRTPCRREEPRCGSGIPRSLPAPTRMLPPITQDEITDRKTVTFSVDSSTRPPKFMIEGDCYKPNRILPQFDLKRDDVEEWTLLNTSTGPHPFHIHVNAFQLMDEGGVWRDTVMIPPARDGTPGKVTIRTRFERFDGTFVTHCHILNHEDLGMMQEVRINP